MKKVKMSGGEQQVSKIQSNWEDLGRTSAAVGRNGANGNKTCLNIQATVFLRKKTEYFVGNEFSSGIIRKLRC